METDPPYDRRVLRAARSLYTNRARLSLIEGRIQRAREELTTYLALAGLTAATLGAYEVKLHEDDVQLTYHPLPGAHQLPLPEAGSDEASRSPLDIFAGRETLAADDWATPATRAIGDWLLGDRAERANCERMVGDAGDVFAGGNHLHVWVFEQLRRRLPPKADEAFLARVLSTVDWTHIAASVAPTDNWEPLTCWQREQVQDLLPPRHFLWSAGETTEDADAIRREAQAGDLPCPSCNRPLRADDFDLLGTPMLRLWCAGCSFEEV